MTPFDRFRQQVQDQPDAVAVVTPYRVASYRKMWSRIERSTARLQGEWGIVSGDTIVYLGCGHLDALVMYFAAARCGARVLPLEHAALQAAAPALVAASGARLVLHDDALDIDAARFGTSCRVLSSLIATVCRHRENVTEDSALISLLQWPQAHGAGASAPDLAQLRAASIAQLAARPVPASPERTVKNALFDIDVFARIVLPALLDGQTLHFGAPPA